MRDPVLGVLILEGILVIEASMGPQGAVHVIGPGDVLFFDGRTSTSLPMELSYRAQTRARLAVLDVRVMAAGRRWPQIIAGLCQRAGAQVELGVTQQAISQLPRVEQRVLGFLWSMADRWGQMHPDGARFTQPFTHQQIGQIIGARRPTVSLGLKALTDAGLVQVGEKEWILNRSSVSLFEGATPSTRRGLLPRSHRSTPQQETAAGVAAATLPWVLSLAGPLADGGALAIRGVADESTALAILADEVPDLMLISSDGLNFEHPGAALILLLEDPRFSRLRLVLIGTALRVMPAALLALAHDYLPDPISDDQLTTRLQAQLAVAAAHG